MNTFFKTKKKLLEKEITYSITIQKRSAKSDYIWSEDALQRLEDFTVSGKMIRGLLVVLAAGENSKQVQVDAVKIGAALEMMHSGILVHDDIMDRDVLRRGKPTIHTQYVNLNKLSTKSENLHFGEGMAICVGIIAYFLAFNKFGELKTSANLSKLIELFSSEMSLLGLGQMDDLYTAVTNTSTEQDCLRIYEQKTGRYTFGLPLLAGLILAGKFNKNAANNIRQL